MRIIYTGVLLINISYIIFLDFKVYELKKKLQELLKEYKELRKKEK